VEIYGPFAEIHGFLAEIYGSFGKIYGSFENFDLANNGGMRFVSRVQLDSRKIGHFDENTRPFCRYIGLFGGNIWLFCGNIGLF